MLPEVIQTDRLLLRPWVLEDAPDLLAYAGDEEWGRYLPVPRPYLEADARRFIVAQALQDRTQHLSWAIAHGGRVIGGMNLTLRSELRTGEIGYSIARAFWGRGLATEAARSIVDAAFEACPELARVTALADSRNLGSIRVLHKLGMIRDAALESSRVVQGEPVEEVGYAISRRDWEARDTPPLPARAGPAGTRLPRIDRGDLFWIAAEDAGGVVGGEPHPHVVVQDDVFNHSRIATVVVCALTSNLHRAAEPGNVLLQVGEGDLPRQSVVVVSQVSSVDKGRLGERIGSLSEARVEQILAGLRFQQRSFFL